MGGIISTKPPQIQIPTQPGVHTRPIDRKLHPLLVAALDCFEASQNGKTPPPTCKSQSDTLTVEVVLASDTPEVRKVLTATGLKIIDGKTRHNIVRGAIAIADLAKLAQLETVRFAGPAPMEAAKK